MSSKKEDTNKALPHVVFLKTNPFEHVDTRRLISGTAGNLGIPLQIRQIKVINFSQEAVEKRLVVGNHKHHGESGQWEFIVVLGEGKEHLFDFRHRNHDEPIKSKKLKAGDVVLVPPGCSLGLVPLKANAKILEISNKEYDATNYSKDNLFEA